MAYSDGAQASMEPPSPLSVDIISTPELAYLQDRIEEAVSTALAGYRGNIAVLLASREEVQRLNRDFRQLDEATDVLTFPSGIGQGGDIAISVPDAQRQADLRGVDIETELLFLAIHGALHLRGLDDETEIDRARMVDEMNLVAESLGIRPDREWASLLHAEALEAV